MLAPNAVKRAQRPQVHGGRARLLHLLPACCSVYWEQRALEQVDAGWSPPRAQAYLSGGSNDADRVADRLSR